MSVPQVRCQDCRLACSGARNILGDSMGVYRIVEGSISSRQSCCDGCMGQGSVLPSCVMDWELQELHHPLHLCVYREGSTLVGRGWSYKPALPECKVGKKRMAH